MCSRKSVEEEQDIFSSVLNAVPAARRGCWSICVPPVLPPTCSRFENTVAHLVCCAFLSIVAGIGGNSGDTQTMTLVIRALALGQVTSSNVRDLIKNSP